MPPGNALAALCLLVSTSSPALTSLPALASFPALETDGLLIAFDPDRGSLTRFLDRATAHDHVDADLGHGLWGATLSDAQTGASPPEERTVGPDDAARFAWRAPADPTSGLELVWSGFERAGLPALEVTVRVSPGPSGSSSRWRIALEGPGAERIREVRFPRFAVARQEGETLAVPVWMGERTGRARELLNPTGGPGRWQWEYPGLLSMQCIASYREDAPREGRTREGRTRAGGPGLLVAANDTASLRKLFAVHGLERRGVEDGALDRGGLDPRGLAIEVAHVRPISPDAPSRYEPPYDVVATAFRGDWYTAAESYRGWALEQSWVRESRIRRGLTPPWLADTAFWVWNRGRSPGVLGPAAVLQEKAGLPASVFWHWWHGCAYDTGFPEYLPPREGAEPFRRAMAAAHERGIRALVYMNQRLWGTTTRSWVEEGAERHAVKGPDGRVAPEVYNTFNRAPCASMCMGTGFWRRRYAETAEAAVRGLGVDGIYMDQACSSLACHDPEHGHPLGGGTWWMEGFRRLEADIRGRCADAGPVALAGEGCGESWLPHLDVMLSLQVSMERYAAPGAWEPIPFFHAVYHACALFYGNYSSLTRPPYDELWPAELAPPGALELLDRKFSTQFRLEQARAFVWGQQPTIANFLPGHLTERREEIDFFLELVRLRREAIRYLQGGTFLRPPVLDVPRIRIPISRLSIYAGQGDAVQEFEADVPRVLASAWEAPDGGVAVAIANISDEAVTVDLSLGSPEYPVPREGSIRRISRTGGTEVGAYADGAAAWKAALGPAEACVYEIVGRGEGPSCVPGPGEAALGECPLHLRNPGFEELDPAGGPAGWTVLAGLDPSGYGPPAYLERFDAVRPVVGGGGRRSPRCLTFPAEGVWRCPVFTHSRGEGGLDGKPLAKASVHQTAHLPPGRYRFAAWLRSADGHLYSAAFALGVNLGLPAPFAHDGSTGIRWTSGDLALRRSHLRDARTRGEWARYETDAFELAASGPATFWIRFHYANENQMDARWQVDDVEIVPEVEGPPPAAHAPCPPPAAPLRLRETAGDREPHLVDAGSSSLADAEAYRLFRRARVIPPGTSVAYRFPVGGQRASEGPLELLVAASGEAEIRAGRAVFRMAGLRGELPSVREWPLTEGSLTGRPPTEGPLEEGPQLPGPGEGPEVRHPVDTVLDVRILASGEAPLRLFEVEVGRPGRTRTRCLRVEADAVAVPWTIGSWDASAGEFLGRETEVEDPSLAAPERIAPTGRWTVRFDHAPVSGHRYVLLHGLLVGTSRIDLGGDGIVEWVAETKGEEIVDVDVTESLAAGENRVVVETTGEHDFLALLEVCPGSTDLRALRLSFGEGDLPELLTRVADATWFWLRELHHEPSGFIDASVPRGRWYGQYWPVDIAFALREWVRWGLHEESVATAALVSGGGWHGHRSNRSGGSDNTAGNILALQLCEILLRADGTLDPATEAAIRERVRAHAEESLRAAEASPFGLVRGTNWENAGNLQKGPCHALSTSLGAALALGKAARLEAREGLDDDGRGDDARRRERWERGAAALRAAVLDRLVFREDHRSPAGFVFPAGTWAFGLRPDGSVEDQPLAGYFWAAGDLAEADGLIPRDADILAVYARTLESALPLFALRRPGTVSGYAVSYDGAETSLVVAALLDRIDALEPLLGELARQTDVERDDGADHAEISRWTQGGPDDPEDTNLVCAAGFLWPLRILAGIDDLLADGRQLRLVPRLPWSWTRLTVNGWPARARDGSGRPGWITLGFELARGARWARLRIRASPAAPGLEVRLGPFPRGGAPTAAVLDGRPIPCRVEAAGDADWTWIRLDAGPVEAIVETVLGMPPSGPRRPGDSPPEKPAGPWGALQGVQRRGEPVEDVANRSKSCLVPSW